MKIITYNVNGIRSALTKNWAEWVKATDADVICLQETKASPDQLDLTIFEQLGYRHYWYSAEKKGYSGVAILSKIEPQNIVYGCGIGKYDAEGRVIRADFKECSVMSVYHPSGSSGEDRQAFKMEWLSDFGNYVHSISEKVPNLVISGDFNICHRAIDIHNPKSNANTSGFLPEERAWMEEFLNNGFIDSFRHLNKEPHHYTWWSFRANARNKNLGWRIDYNMVSKSLEHSIKRAVILNEAKHSDHCPVMLELSF